MVDGPTITSDGSTSIDAIVGGAAPADVDRAVARMDPGDLQQLGARSGDLLKLEGKRATYARALPTPPLQRSERCVLIDSTQRENLRTALGEKVRITKADSALARRLDLTITSGAARMTSDLVRRIAGALEATPAAIGDQIRIRLLGGRVLAATVTATEPAGPVIVQSDTAVNVTVDGATRQTVNASTARSGSTDPAFLAADSGSDSYDDLAGLEPQLAKVREMVELPLARADLFLQLGLEPPRGVLFSGPPGTGKTLLARTVARAVDASFFQISGPEIVSKHYGDSEGRLRDVFKKATAQSPSIIFIDEIDAIAPKRDDMAGDRQLERRVVAQLLTLMDGLSERRGVIVMAATNLPDSLDPALRRPGRFDREIAFGPPDRAGRAAILGVHTRNAPLAADVDLDQIAGIAHGFVGADLAALAREAGLAALRRLSMHDGGYPDDVSSVQIISADFEAALAEVRPSAVREVYTETPDVRWSDVGGADDVKQALIEAVIWPLRHAEAHRILGLEAPRGVLLAGPPGTGKTHLARALANEAGVNFIAIRGAQLLTRHLGESERAVRDVFAKARQSAPCILFFDEVDAVAPPRGRDGNDAAARVVATLLTEIDGVDELRGVFLLGATNRVDQIDPALLRPGRFDRVLSLEAPNREVRRDILAIHTRDIPLAPTLSLDALADATTGLVGADLRSICQSAARVALRRSMTNAESETTNLQVEKIFVTEDDFNHAIAIQRASDAVRTGGASNAST